MTWQTKQTIDAAPLAGLRGGEFALLATIETALAQDVALELTVKPTASPDPGPTAVYARTSLDGVVWSSGVTSGFDASKIGTMPLIDMTMQAKDGAAKTAVVSLARALGWMPPFVQLVVRNESPDTLAATGHAAAYAIKL